MEKPIEYYEDLVKEARTDAVLCFVWVSAADELIAMVKARDATLLMHLESVDSLAFQNMELKTQLDQQLCVTRTLEKEAIEARNLYAEQFNFSSGLRKEIAELKRAVNDRETVISKFMLVLKPYIKALNKMSRGGTTDDYIDSREVLEKFYKETCAIASQQGGEVK